jgi:hypothetical protein
MVVINFSPPPPVPLYRHRKQFPGSAQQEATAKFTKYFYSYFAFVRNTANFKPHTPAYHLTSATSHPFNFLVTVTALSYVPIYKIT